MHNERLRAPAIPNYAGIVIISQRGNGEFYMANNLGTISGETVSKETRIAVYNWAFENGLTPMGYDSRTETWLMSDGEPYTTDLILREAAKENGN